MKQEHDMRVVHDLAPDRWKAFVESNPNGNIYHTPEMFQVFSRAKGHTPRLSAVTRADGTVLALLPTVQITLMNGLLRPLTTRAVSYGSVLAAPGEEGCAALKLLLDSYRRESGGGALFTELRNIGDLSELRPILSESGFVHQDELNFMIDLTQPEEVIWKNIHKSSRQKINSTLKKGTTVQEATRREEVGIAYQFLQEVYARVGVPLADQSLFEAAFDVLGPLDMFKVFMVKVGDEFAGAAPLLFYHGRIIYWYVGASRAFSSYAPGELLVWHTLKWGRDHGFTLFDFGGGGRPDQPYGPREFKAKFGGVQVNYGRETCIHAPMRLKVSEIGYQVYRQLNTRRAAVSVSE